jgi:hypothetical protein
MAQSRLMLTRSAHWLAWWRYANGRKMTFAGFCFTCASKSANNQHLNIMPPGPRLLAGGF